MESFSRGSTDTGWGMMIGIKASQWSGLLIRNAVPDTGSGNGCSPPRLRSATHRRSRIGCSRFQPTSSTRSWPQSTCGLKYWSSRARSPTVIPSGKFFERVGMMLSRSTMAERVNMCGVQSQPLAGELHAANLGHHVKTRLIFTEVANFCVSRSPRFGDDR